MASFIDYNEQLLKYKDAAKEGFIDVNEDPKKAIDPIIINLPNKDGIDLTTKSFIEHEKTADVAPSGASKDGIDFESHSVNNYTDEEITTRTIINENEEEVEVEIIGPARQKLRTSLDVPNYSTMKSGINLSTHSVDDLVDEMVIPSVINRETGEIIDPEQAAEKIAFSKEKLLTSISVPDESPNKASPRETANKLTTSLGANAYNYGDGEDDGVYQPVGAGFEGTWEIIKRATLPYFNANNYEEIQSEDLMEYKEREENSITGSNLQMFFHSMVPYVLGKASEGILSLQREIVKIGESNGDSLFAQGGTIKHLLAMTNNLTYFTMGQLINHIWLTPFTLGYLSSFGFAMKDMVSSVKWARRDESIKQEAESWEVTDYKKNIISSTNGPSLKTQYQKIYSGIVRYSDLDEKNEPEGALGKSINKTIKAIKAALIKFFKKDEEEKVNITEAGGILALYQEYLATELRTKMHEIIDNMNANIAINKDNFEFGFKDSIPSSGVIGGSTPKDDSLVKPLNRGLKNVIENADFHLIKPGTSGTPNTLLGSYEKLLKNKEFQRMAKNIYSYVSGQENYNSASAKPQEIFEKTAEMIKEWKANETLVRNDIPFLESIVNLDTYKTLVRNDIPFLESIVNLDTYKTLYTKSFDTFPPNIYGNPVDKSKIVGDYGNAHTSYETDIENLKASLKSKAQLGYIYVYPTKTDQADGATIFKIPFQFNPLITESGQGARYDSQNMLHRQGQALSYVQTEGQTLTLETEYLMLSDGKKEFPKDPTQEDIKKLSEFTIGPFGNNPQGTFYNFWTPKVVQAVELALRSLVLPIAQNKPNESIMFHKPPMIKIVMGGNGEEPKEHEGLYQMLTYPLRNKKYYHKTYIVTKVTIVKDVETPYYIENNVIIDKHGFKVNLDLTEIDHNYVGAAPDFMNYYAMYSKNTANYVGDK